MVEIKNLDLKHFKEIAMHFDDEAWEKYVELEKLMKKMKRWEKRFEKGEIDEEKYLDKKSKIEDEIQEIIEWFDEHFMVFTYEEFKDYLRDTIKDEYGIPDDSTLWFYIDIEKMAEDILKYDDYVYYELSNGYVVVSRY